ncbi:glutamate-cysteine ligase-domain-containing protein [Pelagophyceae sp. CCMP2097]|nr:glutamate-cysteine ligase-domain-containing protein [Pelagophyceae sp. CCMP2097]
MVMPLGVAVLLCGAAQALLPHRPLKARAHARRAILTVGDPLDWEESKDHLEYVRYHGVSQFIESYKESQFLYRKEELLWGDEIEYSILRVDGSKAWVSLRAPEIRDELAARENANSHRDEGCEWMPEYGSWMVEGTPKRPYTGYASDLLRVERNMRLRRRRLLSVLQPDEICPTMVNFAHFGVGDFAWRAGAEVASETGPIAESVCVPDAVIHPHPRFAALTRNIRARRGENVRCDVPRFFDLKTPSDAPRTIEGLDAMAFGMGACCMQVTFQAHDVREARYVYDQLAALAPVMLALTAASPIWKGNLADTDARWDAIADAVDDRTRAERGLADGAEESLDARLAGGGVRPLARSRYSSISRYAFQCEQRAGQVQRMSDISAPVDEEARERLLAAGLDASLADHVAGLFVRDPLVMFKGRISELDDTAVMDHFENLQSTNWNTVRLKPPLRGSTADNDLPGWRVEFRPMEVQLTDFENAAFAVFSVLVSRVILAFDLNFYLPLSRVDANMRRAQRRGAVKNEKFFFCRHVAPPSPEGEEAEDSRSFDACCAEDFDESFEEMSCAEIIDGKGEYFPGLAPLAYAYLEYIGCDQASLEKIGKYIEFVRSRARGDLDTPAEWIRDFVAEHPDYKQDGVVSAQIARDLSVAAHDVGVGKRAAPTLLGDNVVRPLSADGAWDVKLSGVKLPHKELLRQYAARAARDRPANANANANAGRANDDQ